MTTFDDIIYEVNKKIEEDSFNEEKKKISAGECELLDKTVTFLDIDTDSSGMAVIRYDDEGEVKVSLTDKHLKYFDSLKNKKVYFSGIKTYDYEKMMEKWYIRTIVDVTGREESLVTTNKLTEDEKRKFQKSIEKFSPQIRRDLCDKKIALADKKAVNENDGCQIALYSSRDEMEAYYDIVKKVMPKEFRSVYESSRLKSKKISSSEEKTNYIRVMSDILEFDWINNAEYKYIDVEALQEKIGKKHIGYNQQLNEIYTELRASNISKVVPKTLCFIGNPDTGINKLARTIASSIGTGYSIINLAGADFGENEPLIGSSKIYINAKAGFIYDCIKEAGLRGVLVIEDFNLYESNIRSLMTPLLNKTTYMDMFAEVKIDLSNMLVIVTCSDIKKIPQHVRANMTTIYFQDLEEREIVEIINKVIVPKYCKEYGLDFPQNIPVESCKTLIYKHANMNMDKLDSIIRSIVVKTVAKGDKSFPDYSIKPISDYKEEDYEKIRNKYVREITETEHKFFNCYFEYPECIQKKAVKLFNILNFEKNDGLREHAIDVIHYISNIFKPNDKSLVMGSVIEELSKSQYIQNDFAERIEAAILSKELGNNVNRMTVIGLKGKAGTGKSSAAISVAKALNRNFIKINVGGGGGAEVINGCNKKNYNSAPSLIIKELSKSGHGCYSDVIILDEIDKSTPDFMNTLYEFLDPNEEYFYDNYLECFIPKNNFLVMLTFNDISSIPIPIRDRMEIIEYSSYSNSDKKSIITDYVLPKLKTNFNIKDISIDSEALDLYLKNYDISPGIRNAERDFEYILMRIARQNNCTFESVDVHIDQNDIKYTLGKNRTVGLDGIPQLSIGKCGMAQALAVTTSGIGVLMAVETVVNPYQDKNIVITGLLEGSCLESVSVACCFISKYLKKELPKLHIHITEGMKKDGPSAGVTIAMSILSCLLEKPIANISFTGGIDIYGHVRPVGSVFEKCIAAERCGVNTIILPSESYKGLVSEKKDERLSIKMIPVDTIEEVISYVWGK